MYEENVWFVNKRNSSRSVVISFEILLRLPGFRKWETGSRKDRNREAMLLLWVWQLHKVKSILRKKIIDNCCNRLYLKYIHYLYFLLFLLIPDFIFQDSWFSASQGALLSLLKWKLANADIVQRDPTSTTLFIFCLRWCYSWTLSRKNRKFWIAPDDQPCHFRRKGHYSEISRNSERKKCSWSEAKQLYFSTELWSLNK